jgi:hypothetical protein
VNLSRLNSREKALLGFVATFVPALVLLVFPAFGYRADLAKKTAERDRLEVALGQKPAATDAELASLSARRAALREAIDRDRKALAALDHSFPASSAKALEAVSELAARLGILIRESQLVAPGKDETLPRPKRKFTLVVTFAALRDFVAKLPALRDGPVHVESLSIDTVLLPNEIESGGEDVRALVATVVLVL